MDKNDSTDAAVSFPIPTYRLSDPDPDLLTAGFDNVLCCLNRASAVVELLNISAETCEVNTELLGVSTDVIDCELQDAKALLETWHEQIQRRAS